MIWVQVPLRGREQAVSGDLAEDVYHAGVGHSRQSGVPEIMAAEVAQTDRLDDLVPVRRVSRVSRVSPHRRSDSPAARAHEQPAVGERGASDQLGDHGPNFFDQRDEPSALALGGLIHETARGGRGLAADVPGPRGRVDVVHPAVGHLADAGRGRAGEGELIPTGAGGCDLLGGSRAGAFPAPTVLAKTYCPFTENPPAHRAPPTVRAGAGAPAWPGPAGPRLPAPPMTASGAGRRTRAGQATTTTTATTWTTMAPGAARGSASGGQALRPGPGHRPQESPRQRRARGSGGGRGGASPTTTRPRAARPPAQPQAPPDRPAGGSARRGRLHPHERPGRAEPAPPRERPRTRAMAGSPWISEPNLGLGTNGTHGRRCCGLVAL
ncbi:hypothetical protein EV188_11432 [Actinomycetospora succinea]|uniref:Uncharacterized protein n=1 Tax=Actinomycetospora succinea TaxID=663603 RepID=A0A4R6UU01_9PSEU|nr:hypothetical protein EV188_11432 [Actinomycetospora succinea]